VKAILDLLGYFGLRAASSLICRMPERMAEKTGTVLGACAFSLHSRRRVAYADIKAALGPQFSEKARMQIIRDQYRHFGQMFVEVLRIPRISRSDIEKNVEISNFEYFRQTVDGQCGAILITGHFGNWELLQIISGIFDKPVYALNRPQKLTRMNEYLNRLRKTQGSVTIGRGMGVRDLLRALKRKELVGILGQNGRRYSPIFGTQDNDSDRSFRAGLPDGSAGVAGFYGQDEWVSPPDLSGAPDPHEGTE
jgi:KDO2-lipid IV(A) lauroyltransferase